MLVIVAAVSVGPPAAATEIAAPVRAGDSVYRELRLADLLGLLDGPLHDRSPLSRKEFFRLLYPLAEGVGLDTGLAPVPADPRRGITPSVARRLTRLRDWINPWDVFWGKDLYPVTFGFNPLRDITLTGSDVRGGRVAPEYRNYGEDHTEGVSLLRDGALFIEGDHLALASEWRLRFDRRAVTYRPLVLSLRTGWRNLRLTLGREPLAWGPERHGGLLISTNARPLDQVRIESESPFALPGLEGLGVFTASAFLGKLDDPGRSDAQSPWLSGMRLTYAPARWLVLGAERTTMLGGGGHDFAITPRSVANVLLGRDENRAAGEGDGNDTDQKATVDWSLYLWPVFRSVPVLDGGRLYGRYGGEDSPQEGPLPSATGHTYGIELVLRGVLLRAEASNVRDDRNLWYWHRVYTDGYTYRGRVLGHPMGGDSRGEAYVMEAPLGTWGVVTASMERMEHGFHAEPGVPPDAAASPVSHGVQDAFSLGVEKFLGDHAGFLRIEGRALRTWGDRERLDPLEEWGVGVSWRR